MSVVSTRDEIGASGVEGFGGWSTRFPSRGGVERLMNSILVGSLSEAWRRAGASLSEDNDVPHVKVHTVSCKFFADGRATNLEYHPACWNPI